MDQSWKHHLKEYLTELNKAYVDGDSERLTRFFRDDEAVQGLELRRWQREQEQQRLRGANLVVMKTKAIPIQTAVIGDSTIESVLSLNQQLQYNIAGIPHVQEVNRVEQVRMKRIGDQWAFLWPWGFYFEGNHLHRETDTDVPKTEEPTDREEEGMPEPLQGEAVEVFQQASRAQGSYHRARAVAYAEKYWNTYNPAYPRFEVDCTNYVSQCLHAGGIPLVGGGNRGQGWWFRGGAKPNWSYSWAVAHSLYLLLQSGKAPMHAKQVSSASELQPGDVICYDFDGDGRWQHNTIVVDKDQNGMPLVNAHTTDSRRRYWEYRDSTAYTPKIRYAFFQMMG